MSHYFIDYQSVAGLQEDDEGSDLATFDQARKEAIGMLAQMANYQLPDGEHREFAAIVRDDKGTSLYRATLTFHGERLNLGTQ